MPQTLGILGGGQLGLMLIEEGRKLFPFTHYRVFSNNPEDPALTIANSKVVANYTDADAIAAFAEGLDGVMLEFESIPIQTVFALERRGIRVYPDSVALGVAQDRWNEKQLFRELNIPHAETTLIATRAPQRRPKHGSFPGFLKSCRDGYDGHGQTAVRDRAELEMAWNRSGHVDSVYEKSVPYQFEFSIIVARDAHGTVVMSPAIVNEHKDNILRRSTCPSHLVVSDIERRGREYAESIAKTLNLVGILGVEMFAVPKSRMGAFSVLVNEIAPRPHNSGHGSIEAWRTSQFGFLVQIAHGKSIEKLHVQFAFEMLNLIGDDIHRVDELRQADARASFFHNYHKPEIRPGRKMGHITFIS